MIGPRLEPTFVDAFKENPTWMFLATVFAVAGFVLAVIAVVCAIKRSSVGIALGAAAAIAGLFAIGAGAFDRSRRLHTIELIVTTPGLSPGDIARIRAYEGQEAKYPLFFGAGVGSIPLLLGAVSAGAAAARKKAR